MRLIRTVRDIKVEEVEQFLSTLRREITTQPIAERDLQDALRHIDSARKNAALMNAAINNTDAPRARHLEIVSEPKGVTTAVEHGEAAVTNLLTARTFTIRLQSRLASIRHRGADEAEKAAEVLGIHAENLQRVIGGWKLVGEVTAPIKQASPRKISDLGLRPAIFKEIERDATLLPFDPSKRRSKKLE